MIEFLLLLGANMAPLVRGDGSFTVRREFKQVLFYQMRQLDSHSFLRG